MRYITPQIVKDFYQSKMPKCCHTCEKYDSEGTCLEFDMIPPEEFASQLNVCEAYSDEIPF